MGIPEWKTPLLTGGSYSSPLPGTHTWGTHSKHPSWSVSWHHKCFAFETTSYCLFSGHLTSEAHCWVNVSVDHLITVLRWLAVYHLILLLKETFDQNVPQLHIFLVIYFIFVTTNSATVNFHAKKRIMESDRK